MKQKNIKTDYCSWTIVRFKPQNGKKADYCVRGDIQGPLTWEKSSKTCTGWFELPAKGEEKGFYEIIEGSSPEGEVLQRVNIEYTFDKFYFSPRWENIDQINAYLADRYTPIVQREILYRYPRYKRDIQLLKITDPSVPLSKKQVIFLTARIHNPESGTTATLYRFVQWLLEGQGREFLREYLFLVIPMVIPLTFEEDPRIHSINREWRDDTVEPDLLAIREKVIDRYIPEAWIDCHTFNAEMEENVKKEERGEFGDYIVAHSPEEQFFDYDYSRDIARRLIEVAEAHGHKHRNRAFFLRWEKMINKSPYRRPGEKIKTDFDPIGIFSGRDYGVHADRDGYGPNGRTWNAMACEYGYARCHAVNMCLESKPLHVYWGKGPFHYSRRFSDSSLVKLQELCRLGRKQFPGQNYLGFPCNLIHSDCFQTPSSVILCAEGKDRQELRQSRALLWQRRRSIQIHTETSNDHKQQAVRLFCVASINPVAASLRIKIPAGLRLAKITIDGKAVKPKYDHDGHYFLPLVVKQGKQQIQIVWR